ncbi:hypothetical protein BYT27DRAFT_7195536 [Phlegmacium glaucopus]|nr:hypothetical protein BYT27DRAFT_7195536 [Phlegmacium glaucopus]
MISDRVFMYVSRIIAGWIIWIVLDLTAVILSGTGILNPLATIVATPTVGARLALTRALNHTNSLRVLRSVSPFLKLPQSLHRSS